MTISCNWEEFKQYAKEFHDAVGGMNLDELDNAWKCLGLAYLGMHEEMWNNSAAVVLSMACREFLQREEELIKEEFPNFGLCINENRSN